jgi:hypothetical protein
VEGPSLNGLSRRRVPEDFLKLGDVIDVCGFAFKEDVLARVSDARRVAQPFLHGHVLAMADGEMQIWGSYGRLDNCVRPGDKAQSWRDFLNGNPSARQHWCSSRNFTIASIAPPALVDEINRLMASPCE